MTFRTDSRQAQSIPTEMGDVKEHLRLLALTINRLVSHESLHPTDTPLTISATYTMVDSDSLLLCKADNPITVHLLTAGNREGQELTIKKIDAGATVIVVDAKDSETIDGATTATVTAQYSFIRIKSDGTNWHAVARDGGGVGGGAYTDEQAQDAVGTILTDTATIDFTYTDATPAIEASVKAASITEAMQVLADNTTQDVSTTKHGYAPKGDGSTSKFLNANGAYSTPSSSAGGAMTLIATSSPSGTGVVTFNSIPATFSTLVVFGSGRSTAGASPGVTVDVTFNNDTSSIYDFHTHQLTNQTNDSSSLAASANFDGAFIPWSSAAASYIGMFRIEVVNYALTTLYKGGLMQHSSLGATALDATWITRYGAFIYRSTSAISRMDLTLAAGNWDAGSKLDLYGIS